MRALCSIGAWDFPTPSTYKATSSALVDSARNSAGYVVGSVIRADVVKIEMTWNYLTTEQWSDILKKFNPTYGGAFYNECTYYDQTSNSWQTRNFYVNDRVGDALKVDTVSGAVDGYHNIGLNLIEV